MTNKSLAADMKYRIRDLQEISDDIEERIEQLIALKESIDDAIETSKELADCEDAEDGECYASDLYDTLEQAESEIDEIFDMDRRLRVEWMDRLDRHNPCLGDIALHYFS